jgi:hypothetical protein
MNVGYTAAPLDARFVTVRTKESNIGNFVCDLMRYYYDADCCIMAAGTIRGDQIYPPGVLKLRDIVNCFPFEDPVVVMKVTGKAIWDALENGVSNYPALEGLSCPHTKQVTSRGLTSRRPLPPSLQHNLRSRLQPPSQFTPPQRHNRRLTHRLSP